MSVRPSINVGWLTERTGYMPGHGFRAIEALGADGRVRGMVGFDGWTPAAVWMHVAVDSPAGCRELLRAAFSYAFEECGRSQALAAVRASNRSALRLAGHLGFEVFSQVPNGWSEGENVVLLRMLRSECRWIDQDSVLESRVAYKPGPSRPARSLKVRAA